LPLGATLAAVTEGFPEVVVAVTLAVVRAAFRELHVEVASRVEVDMVVDGVKRRISWTG
jgi:hypothetical protein